MKNSHSDHGTKNKSKVEKEVKACPIKKSGYNKKWRKNNNNYHPQAVLWDMDGVLVHTDHLWKMAS